MNYYISRRSWRTFQVIYHLSLWGLPSSNLQSYRKISDFIGWRLLYLRVLWKLCDNSSIGFSKINARVQSSSYDWTAIFHCFLSAIWQAGSSLDLLRMNIPMREVLSRLWTFIFLSMDKIKRSVIHLYNFSLLDWLILLWLFDKFLYDA